VLINLLAAPINHQLSIKKIDNEDAKNALFKFGISEESTFKIIRLIPFFGPVIIEFGDVSYSVPYKKAKYIFVSI